MTPVDDARTLAIAISEALNALALLASPDQFGPFPDDGWQPLGERLALLEERLPAALADWAAPLAALRESVTRAPTSAEHRLRASALAAELLAKLPTAAS